MEQKEKGETAQMKFKELANRKRKVSHNIYVWIKPNLYVRTYRYLPQATMILIPLEKIYLGYVQINNRYYLINIIIFIIKCKDK